jgi:hypothetical protein
MIHPPETHRITDRRPIVGVLIQSDHSRGSYLPIYPLVNELHPMLLLLGGVEALFPSRG